MQTLNAIKILAQAMRYETNGDFEAAYQAMKAANILRPNNAFIQGKVATYQNTIQKIANLKQQLNTGELAIVPIGFRCFTKATLEAALSFNQPSLPFDFGFFPPQSLISILKCGDMNFSTTPSGQLRHEICRKLDNYLCAVKGAGIHFETSTYQEVNRQVAEDQPTNKVNQWLDNTMAYYTLNLDHGYVLAHYNWHASAPALTNDDISDHSTRMQGINDMLARRMRRFIKICQNAKFVIFAYGETQGHNYMSIDDTTFDLADISGLHAATQEHFQTPSATVRLSDIPNWGKVFNIVERNCPDLLADTRRTSTAA